jgi:hypothetical protein
MRFKLLPGCVCTAYVRGDRELVKTGLLRGTDECPAVRHCPAPLSFWLAALEALFGGRGVVTRADLRHDGVRARHPFNCDSSTSQTASGFASTRRVATSIASRVLPAPRRSGSSTARCATGRDIDELLLAAYEAGQFGRKVVLTFAARWIGARRCRGDAPARQRPETVPPRQM